MKDLFLGFLVASLGLGGNLLPGGGSGLDCIGSMEGHSHDVTITIGGDTFSGGDVRVDGNGTSSSTGTGTGGTGGVGGGGSASQDSSTETSNINECPSYYDRCR